MVGGALIKKQGLSKKKWAAPFAFKGIVIQ
jgi:hypothetical protein